MVLTGQMVDVALAERKGMVSEIGAVDGLQVDAQSIAITPYAKRAVWTADEYSLAEGLRVEHELTVEAFDTEDRVEGLRAFAEKRKPRFKGR